ncbi:hypothetical protein JOC76_000615 [Neobacillus cucumis]|nr:hypothetical protein [Neobacillus cucumis]
MRKVIQFIISLSEKGATVEVVTVLPDVAENYIS